MNRNNPIANALRSQLNTQLHTGQKSTTDHTENVQLKGVIPCMSISKELETKIQKQLEGLKYE